MLFDFQGTTGASSIFLKCFFFFDKKARLIVSPSQRRGCGWNPNLTFFFLTRSASLLLFLLWPRGKSTLMVPLSWSQPDCTTQCFLGFSMSMKRTTVPWGSSAGVSVEGVGAAALTSWFLISRKRWMDSLDHDRTDLFTSIEFQSSWKPDGFLWRWWFNKNASALFRKTSLLLHGQTVFTAFSKQMHLFHWYVIPKRTVKRHWSVNRTTKLVLVLFQKQPRLLERPLLRHYCEILGV